MKTIEQLEEEAKQAREVLNSELTAVCGAILAKPLVDSIINAAVAMMTYQLALASQEAKKESDCSNLGGIGGCGGASSIAPKEVVITQDDGWITWNGGKCPVDGLIYVKYRSGTIFDCVDSKMFAWNHAHESGQLDGNPECDIVAYKISKGGMTMDNDVKWAGNYLKNVCHEAAKNWWKAGDTLNPLMFSNKLCLIHSEISEAMEGDRKGLKDDHLPFRDMREVELADAVIRIFDLAGAYGMDIGGAIEEKLAYNAQRADHKLENRAKEGGKSY